MATPTAPSIKWTIIGPAADDLMRNGVAALSRHRSKFERHAQLAADLFNKRYGAGKVGLLQAETLHPLALYTSAKMYLSVRINHDVPRPTLPLSIPIRDTYKTLMEFSGALNDAVVTEKNCGYMFLKRSTEPYLPLHAGGDAQSASALATTRRRCVWHSIGSGCLHTRRCRCTCLQRTPPEKKREYDSGVMPVLLRRWRTYLPVNSSCQFVKIDSRCWPREGPQSSWSMVPLTVAMQHQRQRGAEAMQCDAKQYLESILKNAINSSTGVFTAKYVQQRLDGTDRRRALVEMASVVSKNVAPKNSVLHFMERQEKVDSTRPLPRLLYKGEQCGRHAVCISRRCQHRCDAASAR